MRERLKKNWPQPDPGFESCSRDYRMLDLPGYMEWSSRKLEEGESDALIAHLDTTHFWLTPEEAAGLTEAVFDEILADLKDVDQIWPAPER